MVLSEVMNFTIYVFVANILVSSLSYVDGRDSKKPHKENELKRRPWLHDYTEDFLGLNQEEYMLIESAGTIALKEGGPERFGRVLAVNRELTKKFNAITFTQFRLSKEAFRFIQKLTYTIEKERRTGISQARDFARHVLAMSLKPGLCRELSQYLEGTNYKRGIKSILETDREDYLVNC
ncbi:unnamed protein product [Cylicocyclus nassatus]|uniref:Uncharacterized protein n=1 Tax=Cylicocyclus nassatus TaxID=53992 RepID=A0AA36GSU0_CYLNA|nr:unnamed protein product [Cylicocyclus nassatus]